jgi:hypothetical protein
LFGDRRGPLPRADRARIKETGWEGQVLCGVKKGGKTVVPFPAEQIPDLVEGGGILPNEVPCGRVVEVNRLSRQHCRRHGMEVFRALRVARRSAVKLNAFETNQSGKPLPRGTYRKRTSLLKKSLSDRPIDRIVSKGSENTAKTLQNYGVKHFKDVIFGS